METKEACQKCNKLNDFFKEKSNSPIIYLYKEKKRRYLSDVGPNKFILKSSI